jgi:hemolysin activation/secretion protein
VIPLRPLVLIACILLSSGATARGDETPAETSLSESTGSALGDAIPSSEELEAQGAVIGRVSVRVGDVFDTRIEGENGWFYRTANGLHIETRPSVIREQLLFHTGDLFSQRLLTENERILRQNPFLYDAVIVPVGYDGSAVDLEVRTRDVWTLRPGFNFGRAGGANRLSLKLVEKNLLGYGKEVHAEWRDTVDRTSLIFGYNDPHFLHPFTRLSLAYADSSDGQTKAVALEQPFYSLETRRSGGLQLFDNSRDEPRYVLGENVGEFGYREEYYEIRYGRSQGLQQGHAARWSAGITYDRNRFAELPDTPLGGPLPDDRELLYPWLGFEWLEDKFQERRNQDQIGRTEDVLLGLRASGRVGLALQSAGSDRNAMIFSGYMQRGLDLRPGHSVFWNLAASGRLEDGGLANGIFNAGSRYYWQTTPRSKFYAGIDAVLTENLDPEHQLLLGGDSGLRGYPLRYLAGTSRALLTLEQRYYSNWYPFRLFHVGAAVFCDIGRTWGRDVTGFENTELLKDVGLGLRLGSSRSSFGNVIHIDLAFPLDGDQSIDSVQILVETKAGF